jgi:AbrB family looped-hinge helix DNA binding protein
MRSTLDRRGRVVLPKGIRDQLGLAPGAEVEITARDGTAVISPLGATMRLVKRRGVLVAEPDRELPVLSAAAVRDALDATRR